VGFEVTTIHRVQYRAGAWLPTTSTRSRTFAREGDAWRFAAKIHSRGGVAIVAVAERSPWLVAEEKPPWV